MSATPIPGWPHRESPFHSGELAVQERVGVKEKLDVQARRGIRDYMPDQHRQFFSQLPFLIVGSVDEGGQPWASVLAGRPGFVGSPTARELDIRASALHADPLRETLKAGAPIGLLGIEPHTRRRNRMNGTVTRFAQDGFSVRVDLSFGNCPQYIQAREPIFVDGDPASWPAPIVHRGEALDEPMQRMVAAADTFFIATAYRGDDADGGGEAARQHGVDVSHRGGKPGFVRIDDAQTLTVPDFVGNFFFNTIGNLQTNPRAGLLFIDFASGDLLYLAVEAEIVWEGVEVKAFAGAERLFRFRIKAALRVEGSLPLRWGEATPSPFLERTGAWEDAARSLAAARAPKNAAREFVISRVEDESDVIRSFYLEPVDGQSVAPHEPGQFLPIRLAIPGLPNPLTRTYTVSDAPNGRAYRISVKREREGVGSRWLHDRAGVGTVVQALAPRGAFTLDLSSKRPLVLLSGGVGITPMIAMLNAVLVNNGRSRYPHPIHFIHGARNGKELAFGAHLRALAKQYPNLTVHVRFSAPSADDELGRTHDSEGHVDLALVKALLRLDDYEFYLCGPSGFMQSLYDGLRSIDVRTERIHSEAFGPSTPTRTPSEKAPAVAEGVVVKFVKSGKEAVWRPEDGSLLDTALAAGVEPMYSCRSGICGTCATRLVDGQVVYGEEPAAEVADSEVLICCATPRPGRLLDDKQDRPGVSLDL